MDSKILEIRPLPKNSPNGRICNALTVDLEDWYQSTCDPDAPITERVIRNTHTLLEIFSDCGVTATFFVLGLVCEKFPKLITEILANGHEIATHGFSHRPVNRMSPEEFAEDIKRSIGVIQNVTGAPVHGYRAPDFTIDANSLWALDILAENNIHYDSSIFPISNPRYGIRGWYRFPHQIIIHDNKSIIEYPISTLRLGSFTFPFVGGGYSRLLPSWLAKHGIDKLNQIKQSAVVYVHPYEINPDEINEYGGEIPLRLRITQ